MTASTERRLFKRIKFDTQAQLAVGNTHLNCQLVDISMKGALVTTDIDAKLSTGDTGTLSFDLGDPAHLIIMEVEIAHCDQQQVGMHCTHIDVDSISHLRRLIELNMGDSDLLQRELRALLDD